MPSPLFEQVLPAAIGGQAPHYVEKAAKDAGFGYRVADGGLRQHFTVAADDIMGTRVVDTASDSGGALIEPSRAIAWEQVLSERSVLLKLATVHKDLSGNSYLVTENGKPTVTVKAADDDATGADQATTYSHKQLTPVNFRSWIPLSRRLLQQANIDIERVVRDNLINQCLLELEEKILVGGVTGMTGIKNESGVSSVEVASGGKFTEKVMVELRAKVETDASLYGWGVDHAWVMSPTNAAEVFNGDYDNGNRPMYGFAAGSMIIRKPSLKNANNVIIFGDWARLHVGMWKDIEIVVDHGSRAAKGECVIRLFLEAGYAIGSSSAFGIITKA